MQGVLRRKKWQLLSSNTLKKIVKIQYAFTASFHHHDSTFSYCYTDRQWFSLYFIDLLMFYQIFLSPHVKQSAIIGNKYGMCEMTHALSNNLIAWLKEYVSSVSDTYQRHLPQVSIFGKLQFLSFLVNNWYWINERRISLLKRCLGSESPGVVVFPATDQGVQP